MSPPASTRVGGLCCYMSQAQYDKYKASRDAIDARIAQLRESVTLGPLGVTAIDINTLITARNYYQMQMNLEDPYFNLFDNFVEAR